MATTCYTSYDLPIQERTSHLETKVITTTTPLTRSVTIVPTMVKEHHRQKDFSRPLHVDCSVEYELPNQAKPPQGIQSEPLLMIHPCYFRKIESQRRSLFVNNMPTITTTSHRNGINVTSMTRLSSATSRERTLRGGASCTQYQLRQPQMSQQAATPFHRGQEQYDQQQLWEQLLPQLPIPTSQNYQGLSRTCNPDSMCTNIRLNDRWPSTPTATAADLASRSPDRPEVGLNKHQHYGTTLGTRKYRQFQRPRRLHPYDVSSSVIPILSIFQHQHANHTHQQVCYNV